MKKFCLVLVLVLASCILAYGQRGRNPQPAPTEPSPINSDRQSDISQRSDNLRMVEKFPVHTQVNSKVYRQSIRPLYREPTKEELSRLAPDAALVTANAAFLTSRNTGLTKLMTDKGCDEHFGVVNSTPYCIEYSLPGAGASYSFRVNDYRLRQFGDLIFTGYGFASIGILTHGIFVDIGDIPLEQVSAETVGVGFLMSIEPAPDMTAADEMTEKLNSGFTNGEFTYQNSIALKENTTFVLRSIAYRGNIYRSIGGMAYDELEFDKRRDVTVVFRVVGNEEGVNATILWRQINDEKSPKLEVLD